MSKDNIVDLLKKLVKFQYMFEQDALEVAGKNVKTEKELAKIYKSLIEKEVEKIEDREDSLA